MDVHYTLISAPSSGLLGETPAHAAMLKSPLIKIAW